MLSSSKMREFIRRVKSVRIPYDIGRLPTNIFDTSEVAGTITADQWKIYITCYAQPSMYKLLPGEAYKCLVMLAEIVKLVIAPVFTDENISTLYRSEGCVFQCTKLFFPSLQVVTQSPSTLLQGVWKVGSDCKLSHELTPPRHDL